MEALLLVFQCTVKNHRRQNSSVDKVVEVAEDADIVFVSELKFSVSLSDVNKDKCLELKKYWGYELMSLEQFCKPCSPDLKLLITIFYSVQVNTV